MKRNPRILVVDDEDQNLELMEALLIPLDYEVFLARDGMEALEMVEQIISVKDKQKFNNFTYVNNGKVY